MVRRMTSGSERIFVIFSKPLIGIKQTIRRWKDIIEAHLCHIYYFSLYRGITFFFEIFAIFGIVFALVFQQFVETRRVICRWKSYGQGATFICRNGFEIPYSFKLILKIVQRTTSGSGLFREIFTNRSLK